MRQQARRQPKSIDLFRFFDSVPRRRSELVLFGVAWRDVADPYAAYSVHWIAETGELYAMRTPDDTDRTYPTPSLLDVASPFETKGLTVEVLGTYPERRRVEDLLRGWREFMPVRDSLSWVRKRVVTGEP